METNYNEKIILDIQINVEKYRFFLTYAVKGEHEERFHFHSNNDFSWCLFASDEKLELFLSPFTPEFGSNEGLNVSKESLINLYAAIRNHPYCRLRLLNLLGPIKQY